jgi:hypothetical protein
MNPEEIFRLMDVAIEKGEFSEFKKLLKEHGFKLSVKQRRAVLCNVLVAAAERGGYYLFSGLWESYHSKLSNEQRREVVYLAVHAVIKKSCYDIEFFFNRYGSELSNEQRKEVAHHTILHVAIKERNPNLLQNLLWCSLGQFGPLLSAAVIRETLYAALEQNRFDSFLILLEYPCSSKLSLEELRTIIRYAIYASIKQGAFSVSQTLLKSYGSELISGKMVDVLADGGVLTADLDDTTPLYIREDFIEQLQKVKSILLSWANDQCQKIATAYGHRAAIQQATKAQGEALIEAESIAAAMNQVIFACQCQDVPSDVPPAEQNVVQEEEVRPKKSVQKALADLYATVEHAYQTFLRKYTALHQ